MQNLLRSSKVIALPHGFTNSARRETRHSPDGSRHRWWKRQTAAVGGGSRRAIWIGDQCDWKRGRAPAMARPWQPPSFRTKDHGAIYALGAVKVMSGFAILSCHHERPNRGR